MSSRYSRVKTCFPSQFLEKELTSFGPSRHDYHGARSDLCDYHGLQKQQFGYGFADGFPTSSYPTSTIETSSWNSPTLSDFPLNITTSEASFADDCSGHRGNGIESLNFSGRTEFIPPPNNLSSLSKDTPPDSNASSNSMALPITLDHSFTMQKLLEPLHSHQNLLFGPAGLDHFNDIVMWNEGLLSPVNDSFFVADAGLLTMPSNDRNSHVMNVDFIDSVIDDAMDVSFVAGDTPYQQVCLDNPSLSHKMTIDYGSSNMPWSHMCVPSSGAASLFQDEQSGDQGNEEHQRKDLSFSYTSIEPLWNAQQETQETLPTVMDYTLYEVGSDWLAPFPNLEAKRDLPLLMPKSPPPSPGLVTSIDNNSATSQSPRKPGRKGPLDEEGRKGASQMRHNRSCLTCKLRKTKCSGKRGETCNRCLIKRAHSRLRPEPCIRGPLPELEDAFCPAFAFAHLELTATQDWMKESQWVAVGNEVSIKVSCGPFLSSMSFVVHEIWQPDPDFLRLPDISSDSHDRMQGYASIPSLPYAISDYNINEVRSECLSYINTISKCPLHLLEKIDGNTPVIVWRSLEAVWSFLRRSLVARQNRLLHNVINLYWTLYAMGRDINLTVESVTTAVGNLRNPSPLLPSQSDVSARIVARQIKAAMALIYKEALHKVLEGLETAYRSNTRTSSAITFCTNIILCLIVGELQIVFDGLSIYNISKEGEDPARAIERAVECCREIEDVLTFYSWTTFFKSCQRYDPIKDRFPLDDASGQDYGVAELGEDFREILLELEDDITDQAETICAAGSKTTLEHKLFLRNYGRLLCQYLKRFY